MIYDDDDDDADDYSIYFYIFLYIIILYNETSPIMVSLVTEYGGSLRIIFGDRWPSLCADAELSQGRHGKRCQTWLGPGPQKMEELNGESHPKIWYPLVMSK